MPKHPGKDATGSLVPQCLRCLRLTLMGLNRASFIFPHTQLGICPELYNILGSVALDEPRHKWGTRDVPVHSSWFKQGPVHTSAILKVCLHGNTLTSCIIQHLLVGKWGGSWNFRCLVSQSKAVLVGCLVVRCAGEVDNAWFALSYYSMYIYCITLTVSLFLLLCWSFMIFEHPDSNI